MIVSKSNLKNSLFLGASIVSFGMMTNAAFAQSEAKADLESVIVTGTRVAGMTAADSAAPITVLGTTALTQGAGSADLRAALGQSVPSFNTESTSGDLGRLILSASLRGLSSNDTLILVNGKRRHGVGVLNLGGTFSGSAAPDISLIPTGAIEHAEVLLDGSAAQYGTDAIAGVMNFILKKNSSGGTIVVNGGRYYHGDGETYDMSLNIGLPLFDKGFVNITLDKKYGNFTRRSGSDTRYISGPSTGFAEAPEGRIGFGATATTNTFAVDPSTGIVPCSNGICIPLAARRAVPYYPNVNQTSGAPEQQLFTAFVNAGYDINDDMHLYAFGSWGHRFAKALQNYRTPLQLAAAQFSNQPCSATNRQGYNTATTATGAFACAVGVGGGIAPLGTNGLNSSGTVISSGNQGTYYTPGEIIMYPLGDTPTEVIQEDDYQYNAGIKFALAGWDFDVGGSYGKDIDNILNWDAGNRSLLLDTHTSPSRFYVGQFGAAQTVFNLDATHQYNIGMAGPLTVAVGLEAREDFYQIKAGDAPSRYKEGPIAFPGYALTDASKHSRKNYAAYVDFAVAPIEALQIDVAGRYEHYSDFGDATIGKITARYDFNPQWAIRGTISTGFRAPTLAEEYYSATGISPTAVTVRLPANSPAAALLGLPKLGPEISTQFSAGIVAHPFEDLSVTIDGYSLVLGNRIVQSATINSLGGAINSPLVNQAIALQGVTIDPTVTQNGVTTFLNGLSTLTQGVDLAASYPTDLGDYGLIDWTLAGNYNQTSISKVQPPPAAITATAPGATFFPTYTQYNFVHSAATTKVGLTANWSLNEWGLTLRETFYGPKHQLATPNGGLPYFAQNRPAVGLFDGEVRYSLTEAVQLAVGGNNMFNIKPAEYRAYASPDTDTNGKALTPLNGGIANGKLPGAYDSNGGFYYARLTLKF